MLDRSNAAQLRRTVASTKTMTRFALAILALASGVYTYLGVRSLLDGSASFVFFAAIIYSAAVSVGIYAFWSYMLAFVPLIKDFGRRLLLFGVMAIGSLMIIAMSSWLNAAALAGSAALEQHLAVTLEGYSGDLDAAHANALSAQSLLPDVRRAAERFARLAENERQSGALTGSAGSGSVVQLLTQMSAQMDELSASITQSQTLADTLFDQGSARMATMRELVSAPGLVQPRADQFAAEAVQLSGLISALQETSVAPSVKRAAADLSLGFIAPIADGNSPDLVNRQDQIIANVRASVAAQSEALSTAADEILAEPKTPPRRFVPLSSAEAVLQYYADFIPSWAGAISIDLLPIVLVMVLMLVNDAMRQEEDVMVDADTMSAGEMMRAVALYQKMNAIDLSESDEGSEAEPEPDIQDDSPIVAESKNDTVTPIDRGRQRGDKPRA